MGKFKFLQKKKKYEVKKFWQQNNFQKKKIFLIFIATEFTRLGAISLAKPQLKPV